MHIIVKLRRCKEMQWGELWEIWKAFGNGFQTSFWILFLWLLDLKNCNGLFKDVWKKN